MKRLLTAVCLLFSLAAFSQKIVKETTLKIENKAARGYLSVVRQDDSREELSLTYVTRDGNKKTKYHNYLFDYDLNKITDEEGVEPKTKIKGKNRGENYEMDVVSIEPNMMGKIVGRIEHVKGRWSGFLGQYITTRTLVKKEKLRNSDDRKLYFKGQMELVNGDVMILVKPQIKPKDVKTQAGIFHVIRVNTNLDIVSEVTFDLRYEFDPIVVWGGEEHMYAIMAPIKLMGGPKNKETSKYYYLKFDLETGKVVAKESFESKVGEWNIQSLVESKNGVTILGPGNESKVGKIGMTPTNWEQEKFDSYQIVHFDSNDKLKRVALTTNEQINDKAIITPGEKKAPKYNGKKYDFIGIETTSHGDIVVAMQDWKMVQESKVYDELILLHFNKEAKLEGYYSVESTAKKQAIIGGSAFDMRSVPSSFTVFNSGEKLLNIIIIQPHHSEDIVEYNYWDNTKTTTITPKFYPRLAQINLATQEFIYLEDLGNLDYFLYNNVESIIPINDGNQFIFIGESKSDKDIYLGKYDLSTK